MSVERVSACNLCESLCGLRVQVEAGERVTGVRGDPDDPLAKGHICPKAVGLKELLHDPDRLRAPVIRTKTGWRTATWDEALHAAVAPLRRIQKAHGRDSVGLYVGNPVVHSHRASLAAQLLTVAIGSRNRFDPNSQDSNPRLFACMQVYGDALTMPVPDVENVDYFLMLGANPAASNGSQMGLGNARARFAGIKARGGRVVLFDPRRTESAAWCTVHHFIRPGGDAALLLAILGVILGSPAERGAIGGGLAGHATLDPAHVAALGALCLPFSPERVGPKIGVDPETIRAVAGDFAGSPRACAYARVGVGQNEFGPVASWLVEALNLVTGNFNRVGGAIVPAPAVDVGPLGRLLVGNRWGRWRSRVRGLPEFLGALPSAVMAEEIETPGPGQIRAMVCMAGNPVLSTPNGERLGGLLPSLEHMVAIDFYINETSRHAHVILPPKHIFETGNYDLILARFGLRNVARYSEPVVSTGDSTRDDWEIATELALQLWIPKWGRGALRRAARGLPERVIDILLRLGPGRTGGRRLSLAELRKYPSGLDLGPLTPSKWSGKLTLVPRALASDIPRVERWLSAQGEALARPSLVLIGRRHVRSNNSWLHNLPALVKGTERGQLFMCAADAAGLGLPDSSSVTIASRTGKIAAKLKVTDEMMPGVVSLPHGYGHAEMGDSLHIAATQNVANINAITDELFVEPVIGTSILNGVPVSVEVANAE